MGERENLKERDPRRKDFEPRSAFIVSFFRQREMGSAMRASFDYLVRYGGNAEPEECRRMEIGMEKHT